ncbi:MAG: P-II family nitrogen regulator [Planctomycetota bacterium]|jgi:nitrogen regulatory protein P-II 1|nr:P-II family nitrogen regulator [Planctomycetota bacterium]
MRKLEIIVRPERRDSVKRALVEHGVRGMTLTDIRGFGRQGGYKEIYRGKEVLVEFVEKLKVETIVEDDRVDAVIEAIRQVTATGMMGDGKIFIYPVDDVVRIRTGEKGSAAL